MTSNVTQIPASSIAPTTSVKKVQADALQRNTSNLFKAGLSQPSILFSHQGISLIQSQVSTLQGGSSLYPQENVDSPVASTLLPFLLKELHKAKKSETNATAQTATDPLEPKDDTPESKIQALNELIEDFNIEEDTDFMDLSRWVMNVNNEMSLDDE